MATIIKRGSRTAPTFFLKYDCGVTAGGTRVQRMMVPLLFEPKRAGVVEHLAPRISRLRLVGAPILVELEEEELLRRCERTFETGRAKGFPALERPFRQRCRR